mgnify:CR=1 FL=1
MSQETITVTHILVPLDGSPQAEHAIPWAADLARRYSAQLVLFRVGHRPEMWSAQDVPSIDLFFEKEEGQCVAYLAEAKAKLSQLLDAATAGDEVVIARSGKAVARLVPVDAPPPRRLGFLSLDLDDALFAPLDDDELARWE